MVGGGGVRAVVSAMGGHAGHAGVQRDGCCALGNVSSGSNAHRKAVVAGGGVQAIKSAMRRHAGNSVVMAHGRAALKALGHRM